MIPATTGPQELLHSECEKLEHIKSTAKSLTLGDEAATTSAQEIITSLLDLGSQWSTPDGACFSSLLYLHLVFGTE